MKRNADIGLVVPLPEEFEVITALCEIEDEVTLGIRKYYQLKQPTTSKLTVIATVPTEESNRAALACTKDLFPG